VLTVLVYRLCMVLRIKVAISLNNIKQLSFVTEKLYVFFGVGNVCLNIVYMSFVLEGFNSL
jgi:hypothetical protein